MPDHSYWRRTLRNDVGRRVTLFMLRSNGYSWPANCRLLDVSDPGGPVVDMGDGQPTRLRDWSRLIGIQSTLRRSA